MRVSSWGAAIDGDNNIWMPVTGTECVIKRDGTGNVSLAGKLDSDKYAGGCILKSFCIDDEVFFFSRFAYEMWILNKISMKVKHITYCESEFKDVADVVIDGRNAWVFTASFSCPLLKVNLDDFSCRAIPWFKTPYEDSAAFTRAQKDGTVIYTATRKTDDVYLCEVNTEKEYVRFEKKNVRMINCLFVGRDNCWALALNKKEQTVLQKYEKGFKNLKEEYILNDMEPVDEIGRLYYFNLFVYGELAYFIPSAARKIYIYNLRTQFGHFLDYPSALTRSKAYADELTFADTQYIGDVLYLFPHYFNQVIKLNLEDSTIGLAGFDYDYGLVCDMLGDNNILYENQMIDLTDFIILANRG